MTALDDASYAWLQDLLLDRLSVRLEDDKRYLAEQRLDALARHHAGGSLNELVMLARRNGTLHRDLLEAMTIRETYFFRDPLLTQCLADTALPALLAARAETRTLRIWSAACSTGQEAYSVAMFLREHYPQLADWRIELLASDFSRQALAQARTGRYGMGEVNRGLPARLLTAWFTRDGLHWQAKPALRAMVEFREINLFDTWPELPAFDIVLLRNVLIYFPDTRRRELLARIDRQLAPDGFLLLGATESLERDSAFRPAPPGSPRPCFQPAPRRPA